MDIYSEWKTMKFWAK